MIVLAGQIGRYETCVDTITAVPAACLELVTCGCKPKCSTAQCGCARSIFDAPLHVHVMQSTAVIQPASNSNQVYLFEYMHAVHIALFHNDLIIII